MQKNEAGLTIGLKTDQLNWCGSLMSVRLNTLACSGKQIQACFNAA